MRLRATASLLLGVAALAFAAPAERPASAQSRHWVTPPGAAPHGPRGDRARNLDALFGALKAAPDEASAKAVEDRIWAAWLVSGSETTNLLMTRVKNAIEGHEVDLALRLLDAIIEIRPQYVEAWNRRATVFFMKKDFANALADLRQVLRREPRHFGALENVGLIMQEIGDDKNALAAYRKALAIHPRLKGLAEKIRVLADKVDGRAI
jgi:tetratricopeptide (TPR) repeat protein